MFTLTGRVAVITGSARGLGRALAKGFAESGASVVVCDRNESGARQVVEELVTAGHRGVAEAVDVASTQSCQELVQSAVRSFGRLDVWVNNAAVDVIGPVLQLSPADWDHVLAVNLTGAFHASQQAARQMVTQGTGGSIINITSIAATVGIHGLAAYSAAKAGLNQLTRVMALELAPSGIRVNAVAPGYLENVMEGAEAEHADPAKEGHIRTFTPLSRRARLSEVVGPVLFLASDAASYVTGTVLFVDGGYSAV
jgi:NAD(P)-dependent dehydrogenase (short-subunit alcohol dehydrogenase family)